MEIEIGRMIRAFTPVPLGWQIAILPQLTTCALLPLCPLNEMKEDDFEPFEAGKKEGFKLGVIVGFLVTTVFFVALAAVA